MSIVARASKEKKGGGLTRDLAAPYQNEVTKSGTNSEVAHNDDSYSPDNTDPTRSNEKQGEALDASPANAAASRSADAGNSSNKSGRNQTSSSGFNSASGSQGNRSGNKDVSRDDTSTAKFDKLSKENEDVQDVGGRKVTN